MIEGLLVLLVCQIVGELAVRTLHLAVPGPVLGMLLLLAVLVVRRPRQDAPVLRAGDRLVVVGAPDAEASHHHHDHEAHA